MVENAESTGLIRPDEREVEDEAADNEQATDVLPIFEISAYGADYPVDALVQRLRAGDIIVPQWQRQFVWTRRQCSRFIESLLLGLPVPGIFFYQDTRTRELVVLDGQQRLKTLLAYYMNDLEGSPFPLPQHDPTKYQTIHPDFAGKRYSELPEEYRRRLDNSIIHTTIVKQDSPAGPGEISSVYHIFERINSAGANLTPQEIRTAIFSGALDNLLQQLNAEPAWREIYGVPSRRLKDQELVLRYLALLTDSSEYSRPMTEFLNVFMAKNRGLEGLDAEELSDEFRSAVGMLARSVGSRVFRPVSVVNAAVFDSTMVGLTRRLRHGAIRDELAIGRAYTGLLSNQEFQEAYQRATSDDASVRNRLEIATEAFSEVG